VPSTRDAGAIQRKTRQHPGKAFQGKSANGTYGDWVEEADWSVGRVLDTLRELKLDSRTLVLFTSDNGPWLTQGKNGGAAGPLRGGKGSTWEEGAAARSAVLFRGQPAAGGPLRPVETPARWQPTLQPRL